MEDHFEIIIKLPAGLTGGDAEYVRKQMLEAGKGALRQLEEDRFRDEVEQVFEAAPALRGVFAPIW